MTASHVTMLIPVMLLLATVFCVLQDAALRGGGNACALLGGLDRSDRRAPWPGVS